jgi:hypothetical protein
MRRFNNVADSHIGGSGRANILRAIAAVIRNTSLDNEMEAGTWAS